MAPTIDVVVVAYNRFDLTESCLGHLAAQTVDHRLIVVDNGSRDDTSARLAAEWPAALTTRRERNSAFSVACNAGVALGSGEVIVLLNNDVDCRPDFLERLVEPLTADAGVGSVAALCIRPDGRHIDSIGMTSDVTLAGFPRLQGRPVEEAGSPHPTLTGPAGTAAAYRRTAWEQVGGLDERFFAYNEDFDLALRLRAAGWASVAAPDAVGVHLGSATHGHRSAWQRRHGGFGRGYALRRYGVFRGRTGVRAAAMEALVVAGDAAISRDLAALRGRIAGWRAARGLPPRTAPPPAALDQDLSVWDTINLRRGVYAGTEVQDSVALRAH